MLNAIKLSAPYLKAKMGSASIETIIVTVLLVLLVVVAGAYFFNTVLGGQITAMGTNISAQGNCVQIGKIWDAATKTCK